MAGKNEWLGVGLLVVAVTAFTVWASRPKAPITDSKQEVAETQHTIPASPKPTPASSPSGQSNDINLRDVVIESARRVQFTRIVPDISLDTSIRGDTSISVVLAYQTTAHSESNALAAAQQSADLRAAAPIDTDVLMRDLIQNLMARGFDPTSHRTAIHICAQQGNLKTLTGKAGVIPLGCQHYNPYKDTANFEAPDVS